MIKKMIPIFLCICLMMLFGCGKQEVQEPTKTTEPEIKVTEDDVGLVSEYITYFVPDGYVEIEEEDEEFLVNSNMIASSEFQKGKIQDKAVFNAYIYKAGTTAAKDAVSERDNGEGEVKEITLDGHTGFSAISKNREYRIVGFETDKYTYLFYCPLGNKSNEKAFNEFLTMLHFYR